MTAAAASNSAGKKPLQLSLPLFMPPRLAGERMADAVPDLWRVVVTMTVDEARQRAECLRGTPDVPIVPTCFDLVHRCFLSCVRAANGNRVWPSIEHIVEWIARKFPRAKAKEHSVRRAIEVLEVIGVVRKITNKEELGNGPGAYQYPVELRRAQGLGETTPTYDLAGSFEQLPEMSQKMIEAQAIAMGLTPEEDKVPSELPPSALAGPEPETRPQEGQEDASSATSAPPTTPPSETAPDSPSAPSKKTFPQDAVVEEQPSGPRPDPSPPPDKERSLKIEEPRNSPEATKPPEAAASCSQIWQGDIDTRARTHAHEEEGPEAPSPSPEPEAERVAKAAKEAARQAEKRMRSNVARLQALVEANRSTHADEKPLWTGAARNLLIEVSFGECEEGIAYVKWMKRRGTEVKNFGGYFLETMWTAIAARDLKGSKTLPPWDDAFDDELRREKAHRERVEETAQAAQRARDLARDLAVAVPVTRLSEVAENGVRKEAARDAGVDVPPVLSGPRTLVAIWPKFVLLLSRRLPPMLISLAVSGGKLLPTAWDESEHIATLSCRSEMGREKLRSGHSGGGDVFFRDIVGDTLRDALSLPYATTVRVRFVDAEGEKNESQNEGRSQAQAPYCDDD